METWAQILHSALQKAGSEIVVFLVVIAVFFLPLYILIVKDRKANRIAEAKRIEEEIKAQNARQDKYMERERGIIQVVTANTEVMASLKATLERDGKATTTSLDRIHTRIDEVSKILGAQDGAIVKMQTSFEETLRNHQWMKDDMRKILFMLSKEEHEEKPNGGDING